MCSRAFIVLLLAYGMLWQGLLTVYSQAAMAGQGADRLGFVICSPLDHPPSPGDTEEPQGHDCCLGLCQSACRGDITGLQGHSGTLGSFGSRPTDEAGQFQGTFGRIEPHRLAEARGPPPLV